MEAWKEARQKSDFKLFLPWLTKTIELSRQKARCYGPPTGAAEGPAASEGSRASKKASGKKAGAAGASSGGSSLYDALLDEYEPGMTAQATREIFDPLRARLVPLIERASAAGVRPSEGPTRVETPLEKQKQFVRLICEKIGFDFAAGRMDESAHPFCDGIGPGDTRMTNRYRADGWIDALGTAMHESGHALYEQGLPKAAHFGQPLAEAVSLGIHESQSRLWENLVGRSRVFWKWATPLARQVFGDTVARWSDGDMYKAANLVKPGLIRVESDEVTYNLHIMLRFDLERAMIEGELSPKDLPGVWNERMKSDLGLSVPDDRRGCLQDVHWSMGLVGYFPTYTFGNLYAAQFWEKMATDLPDRDKRMGRGDFSTILGWLRENIHVHGRQFRATELCKRVTGAALSHDALLRHLDSKVKQVYGV
jgi:carboxypeptidase Taq